MEEQMRITDPNGERIILPSEVEEREKLAKELKAAINRAGNLIEDARIRYTKEKTRARSKKAAQEKDAALQSPRFNVLKDYDRKEDIIEAYGWDIITEAECDRLEALWDEREAIQSHTEDGIYIDYVTKALGEAWVFIQGLWETEITEAEGLRRDFDRQQKKAEAELKAWRDRQDAAYRKMMNGGGTNGD